MSDSNRAKNNRWLTPQAAAEYLGCSRNFLDKDRLTHLHGIHFCRLGRHFRYEQSALDAFMERNKEVSLA